MNKEAAQYIKELQDRGPVRWAQGPHGWIDSSDQPVTLEAWQIAALDAWFQVRSEITTLGLSNVKKTGKTFILSLIHISEPTRPY